VQRVLARRHRFYYSIIKGFDAFSSGGAARITGLSAPNDTTLMVTLNQPAGDLPFRFAMPATAPIPPKPGSSARLGVAKGHDRNYGRFLVATGPYMFSGSESLDVSQPASDQVPVAGYQPGKSIDLVRNPSWDPATDPLRPAFPDRIHAVITSLSAARVADKIDSGALDLALDGVAPLAQLRHYQRTPSLRDQVHIFASDSVRYLSMNIAQPPFDDIHVRKAVNFVINKQKLRGTRGGAPYGAIATHVIVNSLEDRKLRTYDPYATQGHSGSLAKAENADEAVALRPDQ
jgi:peptide/nickel transport system substrate-binding protein